MSKPPAILNTTSTGPISSRQLETATIREFSIQDANSVIGVGKTSILRTTDGGATWTDVAPADERIVDLRAVHFIDASNGWIAGSGREEIIDGRSVSYTVVLRTKDGGATWTVREFSYETTGLEAAALEETEVPMNE